MTPFAVSGCEVVIPMRSASGRCSNGPRSESRFFFVGSVASKMLVMMFETPNV